MNTYICIICYDLEDTFMQVEVTYAVSEEQAREQLKKHLSWNTVISSVVEIKGVVTQLAVM